MSDTKALLQATICSLSAYPQGRHTAAPARLQPASMVPVAMTPQVLRLHVAAAAPSAQMVSHALMASVGALLVSKICK